MTGQTARDAGILAAPITGQPGQLDYPADTPLRVELNSGPTYGLRYSYHFDERQRWGVELGAQRVNTEIEDPETFDRAAVTEALAGSTVDPTLQAALVDRLERNRGPYDIRLDIYEVGAVFIPNPSSRFPAEIDAGLGWSVSHLDQRATFERLVISRVFSGDLSEVANEPVEALPGQCQADNDPCIEEDSAGGLVWYGGGGISFAFTKNVMLRLNGRLRFIEQVVDPGDSFVNGEVTAGLSFLFGGE